ncbi:MAG: hypothetical protein GY853_14185 [PVC group bacterium]|nr:hypothetical protein [PVC group bacterium]
MITKKLHNKLIKKWSKHGNVYQNRNERVLQRMKWFKNAMHLIEGLDVLEIGCNAGLFAAIAKDKYKTYTGLEKKENYFKQALETQKACLLHYAEFLNISLKDIIGGGFKHEEINAVILSRVLYHMYDDEIDYLKYQMLPNCRVALVICGTKGKNRTHNEYDFTKPNTVGDLFKDVGMKFAVTMKHERFYAGVAIK